MAIANFQFQRGSQGYSVSKDGKYKPGTLSQKGELSKGLKDKGKQEESPIVEDWAEDLRHLPVETVKKAWFTTAHMLLDPGAHVVDMGCSDGAMTYAMAVLNPNIKFTGVDIDRESIDFARETFQRPNLRFEQGDIGARIFDDNSLDGIINSFILHEIYSAHNFNENIIVQALENQFKQLKDYGLIFTRDFAIMEPDEMVMIEMPDVHSNSSDPEEMTDPELLEYYADQARSNLDTYSAGFPLEELPPRYPGTRRFRLPYKWAYEFIVRNNDRENWEEELVKEYTFYTQRDFSRILGGLGTRVLYTAPHWNQDFINHHYLQHFRMYDDDGKPLGAPPTSFISLAKKLPERQSLALEERRTAKEPSGNLNIHAMRNEVDGRNIDIASRDIQTQDVIPYRVGSNNRLKIFLHDGAPRPIMNTIPRNGKVLDGKRWSGHMIEPISIDIEEMDKYDFNEFKDTAKFCRDYLGLKPVMSKVMEDGPRYYPAPDFIDDRIETRYINVQDDKKIVPPKYLTPDKQGFSDVGVYREFDAQDILDAISVGLIPLGTLELQIMNLYKKLDITPLTWAECPLVLQEPPEDAYENIKSATQILKLIDLVDERYRDIKGTAGDLRVIPSVFVDEGREGGGIAGLASREMDFVISEERTINTAVVLPLSRDHSGEVLACLQSDYFPVPQRYKGSSRVITIPSVDLPRDIASIEDAKRFIADKYGTNVENVAQMGEPYYSHIGMTPRRIFPFAITAVASAGNVTGGTVYTPLSRIAELLYFDGDFVLHQACSAMLRFCSTESDLAPARRYEDCLKDAKYRHVANLSYRDGATLSQPPPGQQTMPDNKQPASDFKMPRPTGNDWGDQDFEHS